MKITGWDSVGVPNITGIGSLPHSHLDTALEFSLREGIPFFPQIPIRNPSEYMIPQALDQLPGLKLAPGGTVCVNLDLWKSQSHLLENRLKQAFATQRFDEFEPFGAASCTWEPFLWELQERKHRVAKIQIAGPFTCQWAIQTQGEGFSESFPELSGQIYHLVLARALAMVSRLNSLGIHPILFIDEPGLYAYSPQNPKHLTGLRELKIMVQTLKKAQATVGIHCCGNTDWSAVCETGIDLLSLDVALSLPQALSNEHQTVVEPWIRKGGRFSFGIIPTGAQEKPSQNEPSFLPMLEESLRSSLQSSWIGSTELVETVLRESLYTPACGLALHSISEAEEVWYQLLKFYHRILG